MKTKRWAAAAVILAVCAVVGLRVSDRQGAARAVYERNQEDFYAVAQQVLAHSGAAEVTAPSGVKEVSYWPQNAPTVEFLLGCWGFGSSMQYWGVNYVPDGEATGFQGVRMEHQRPEGDGVLFYEAQGDNTCYVEPLGDGWFYFEAHF